ncbi:MAG: GFA family protein [Steroidobacteraceae bacterium]
MTSAERHLGGCLCGGIRYAVSGPLRAVIACHCEQCRRTSGHFAAMTSASRANIALTSSHTLRWYRSSDTAERGFCEICGSNLFWRPIGRDTMSITAGSLDAPTGLAIEKHIFVRDKSDYYQIQDHLPERDQW